MKKLITGIVIPIILSGCITVEEGPAEYYDPYEVIDVWEEGIYDGDLDLQMSAYWPDSRVYIHREGREPEHFEGRGAIQDYFSSLREDGSSGEDYDLPDYGIIEDDADMSVWAFYTHWDFAMGETLTITRRGDLWGIERQELVPFEAKPLASPFQESADEDGDGKLDLYEQNLLIRSVHTLLLEPHEAETYVDWLFDGDDDGFIYEEEMRRAREYFFYPALARYFDLHRERAREWADINRDGRVELWEIRLLRGYLINFNPGEIPDLGPDHPLSVYLDDDMNGQVEEWEKEQPFWSLTGEIALSAHPENPLEALEQAQGDISKDGEVDTEPPVIRQGAVDKLQGKRIAVVDIESVTEKISDETRRGLILFVENSFVNTGQVKVVDRNSIEKIIEENRFQASGLTDEETAVEIGKLAGAEIIVTGSVSSVGSNFYLQLRLIDVETAEVVASSLGEAKIENEFLNMSSMAVERLF